jgi:hypothetical protein
MEETLKLHLGCGGRYLDGYRNIDFPPSEHTVQTDIKVDEYADIRELVYPRASIGEVRLHHVFEHFTRPVALALLSAWNAWLVPGGTLRIEVPDFDRTARRVLSPLTSAKRRGAALRHIFGSQEAPWAVHLEGWSAKRLAQAAESFGFRASTRRKNRWKGTYNVDISFRKTSEPTAAEARSAARDWLSKYLVDGEAKILDVWMAAYDKQVETSWPPEPMQQS